jgi:hypothetical protein
MACKSCQNDVSGAILNNHFKCFGVEFNKENISIKKLDKLYKCYHRHYGPFMSYKYWNILMKCEEFYIPKYFELLLNDVTFIKFKKIIIKGLLYKNYKSGSIYLKWYSSKINKNKLCLLMYTRLCNWSFEI